MAKQVTIDQQLKKAATVLCEYAKRLPPGYLLALHASAGECYLELTNHAGRRLNRRKVVGKRHAAADPRVKVSGRAGVIGVT